MGHIHLLVADPDAQKKVWMDALGATEVHLGPLDLMRLPGIYIIIGKARTAPADGDDGSTVNHFGFLVKDMAAVKAKLDALHVESAPVAGKPKQMMVKFPEKVTVELTEDAALPTAVAMHHIHLATTDPEKLRAWYVKTFGASAGARDGFLAAFIPGGEVDVRKMGSPQAPTKGRSVDHIGFEVKNLEAFCKQFVADGGALESPFQDVPSMGLKYAFVVDPDGTRIELTEGLAGR